MVGCGGCVGEDGRHHWQDMLRASPDLVIRTHPLAAYSTHHSLQAMPHPQQEEEHEEEDEKEIVRSSPLPEKRESEKEMPPISAIIVPYQYEPVDYGPPSSSSTDNTSTPTTPPVTCTLDCTPSATKASPVPLSAFRPIVTTSPEITPTINPPRPKPRSTIATPTPHSPHHSPTMPTSTQSTDQLAHREEQVVHSVLPGDSAEEPSHPESERRVTTGTQLDHP